MNKLEPIQAITFDVGGTLIDPWPSVGQVYADQAARFGAEDLDADRLNRQFREAWQAQTQFDYTRAGWLRLVQHTFEGILDRIPDGLFQGLYERFASPEVWKVHGDVLPTIDSLASQGFKLGIISNWDPRLRPLLQALRLDRYFEALVISCEVGFTKPSPVIFEQAARFLGVPMESILHVGNSYAEDVQGARAAKLQALQLDRKSEGGGEVISSLRELEGRVAISNCS